MVLWQHGVAFIDYEFSERHKYHSMNPQYRMHSRAQDNYFNTRPICRLCYANQQSYHSMAIPYIFWAISFNIVLCVFDPKLMWKVVNITILIPFNEICVTGICFDVMKMYLAFLFIAYYAPVTRPYICQRTPTYGDTSDKLGARFI